MPAPPLLRFAYLPISLTLLLSGCGTPPPAEVAQHASSTPATTTATTTPRRPTATARPAPPTPRPATAVPPTVEPTPEPLPSPTAAPNATAVVVNGGNVRVTPRTGEPLDQVHAHETVPLVGKNADASWYLLITPRNITGWVSARLLRIDPTSATQVPIVPTTTRGTPAGTAATDGWTTHTIDQSSIQLPPDWQSIPLTEADLERAATALDDQNPALANVVRQLSASGRLEQLRFLGIDTSPAGTGSTVNVMVVPRPSGMTPDTLLSQTIAGLPRAVPGMKLVSGDSKHHVNGLPAGRVVYDLTGTVPGGPAATLRGVQWYVVGATQVFVITITGPVGDALITVADRIGQSFITHAAEGSATTGTRRQVVHGGNLRQAPKVASSNIIGQVCPGDQVALLDQPARPGWAAVRIAVIGPDCDPKRVPAGTEGWVSTSLLGPVPQDGSAALPPSLQITKLVPFTHARTRIAGLRPENWTLFETGATFQISSSPEAPDGFLGMLIDPNEYPADGAAGASRAALTALRQNQADGTPPKVHEEQTNPDGSGVLLVTVSGVAQGSTQPVRMTSYARMTITARGVLVAIAVVPADVFPQQEALIRQMVDSLRVTD